MPADWKSSADRLRAALHDCGRGINPADVAVVVEAFGRLYRAAELVGSDAGGLTFVAHTLAGPEVRLIINCNDTFGYACADAEEVPWHRIEEVAAALKKCDLHGDIIWAQRQRGGMPFIAGLAADIAACVKCRAALGEP